MFVSGGLLAQLFLPDCQHAYRRRCGNLVVKRRENVDALDRVAYRRIDEHQDAIEHPARHIKNLRRDHDRLTQCVVDYALGLLILNP